MWQRQSAPPVGFRTANGNSRQPGVSVARARFRKTIVLRTVHRREGPRRPPQKNESRSNRLARKPVRLWRLWHEFWRTATDKRSGFPHTIGRISTATLRVPSQVLGELSETKVPGEPLTIPEDGTWRPFLPLPDDFVSVLNLSWFRPRTVRFYTSQGITRVTGPRSLLQKIKAAWRLTFHFQALAQLRNWNEDHYPPSRYVDRLRALGFQIEFEPWPIESTPTTSQPGGEDGARADP